MRFPNGFALVSTTLAAVSLVYLAANIQPAAAHGPFPGETFIQLVPETEPVIVGKTDPNQQLQFLIALRPPHKAEEEAAVQQAQITHRFFTPADFIARFSPSESDEQAVIDWATANGLTVSKRFPNRLLVDFIAPVKNIEKAFNVQINNYQLTNRVAYSNDRPPTIPEQLKSIIQSVQGLDNLHVMQANMHAPPHAAN